MSLLSTGSIFGNSASEIPCEADCMSNYFVAIGEEVKK